jgi:dissimilatory sulfite reductase (desulfoviridin) alpha/beta subunit
MKWTPEAEAAIQKVPFFVRRKVRARVEAEALQNGRKQITLAEVKGTQRRYLTGMQSEIKGYQLDACFGPSGCPNAIASSRELVNRIEALLIEADLLGFLLSKGIRELKFHHEFRVTVSDCPNACSQPQIKDIGVIGARRPGLSDMACTGCEACVENCREAAITIDEAGPAAVIDMRRCVTCGICIPVCPSGTLTQSAQGYRIQLGGKLGRHPQLARELPGIYDADTSLEIIDAGLNIYKAGSQRGERFGEVLKAEDFAQLATRFSPKAL